MEKQNEHTQKIDKVLVGRFGLSLDGVLLHGVSRFGCLRRALYANRPSGHADCRERMTERDLKVAAPAGYKRRSTSQM